MQVGIDDGAAVITIPSGTGALVLGAFVGSEVGSLEGLLDDGTPLGLLEGCPDGALVGWLLG